MNEFNQKLLGSGPTYHVLREALFVLALLSILASGISSACEQTLRSYGAAGDGSTNDTNAVRAAFQSGCDLDGENLTYALAGSLEIGHDITLKNARFLQTGTASNIRTLMKLGGTVTLQKVTVDRGKDERNGSMGDSAGIFLYDVTNALLEDVEVTGNGYGAGIWISDSRRVTLMRPYVHDMRWSTVSPPRYEQLFGIWIVRSQYVNIVSGKVINLLGETGDNVYRSWQSDGITLTATKYTTILGIAVENTGEGIDVTGSEPNEYFEIAHSSAIDSDSFGFKVANSGRHGVIRDSIAIRPGFAGFVVSGPSEADLPVKSSDITIERCRAINAGANGRWSGYPISGFIVMQGSFDLDYPKRVRVIDSDVTDNQSLRTTKFGFYSEIAQNGTFNVSSSGQLIEGNLGFTPAQYGFAFIKDQGLAIMGCALKPRYVNYYFDQSYLAGWTQSRFVNDLQDTKRRELFELCQ